MTVQICKMLRLDYRGRIVQTRLADYHSTQWANLVSQGFISGEIIGEHETDCYQERYDGLLQERIA